MLAAGGLVHRLERPSAPDAPNSCGRAALQLAPDKVTIAACDYKGQQDGHLSQKCFAAGTVAAVTGGGPQPPAVLSILEPAMVMHVIIQLLTTPASKTGVPGRCGFKACWALGQHRCGVVQRRREAHGFASPTGLWPGASAAPAAGEPGGSRKTGFEAALLLMPRLANSAMA